MVVFHEVPMLQLQACLQELVQTFGRALDPEVEAIVPVLAKKAGEMSTAGRETFLAMEASSTLAAMADLLSVGRVRHICACRLCDSDW